MDMFTVIITLSKMENGSLEMNTLPPAIKFSITNKYKLLEEITELNMLLLTD